MQYLSNCIVGASLEEIEEEEEDSASVKSDVVGPPKEGTYHIIGSLKNPNKPKPAWVQEIVSVSVRTRQGQFADQDVKCRKRSKTKLEQIELTVYFSKSDSSCLSV